MGFNPQQVKNADDVSWNPQRDEQVLVWDSTTSKIEFGRKITHGTSAPSSPAVGDIWMDTT